MKRIAAIGTKIGMTRCFTDDGVNVPATVLQVGPCAITQIKTTASDGYSAIQLGYEDVAPKRSTIPVIGHDAKAGVAPKRHHRELRFENDKDIEEFELGGTISAADFEGVFYVDVVGTSKGKGFQGVMKRHNFKGQLASHGVERKHRSPGSITGHATNLGTGPKIKKGKRMAGHMGAERVTTRNHEVIRVDPERHLLLIKGAVPGPNTGLVFVQTSKRLGRKKQHEYAAKEKAS